jgi:hypothetical protein
VRSGSFCGKYKYPIRVESTLYAANLELKVTTVSMYLPSPKLKQTIWDRMDLQLNLRTCGYLGACGSLSHHYLLHGVAGEPGTGVQAGSLELAKVARPAVRRNVIIREQTLDFTPIRDSMRAGEIIDQAGTSSVAGWCSEGDVEVR